MPSETWLVGKTSWSGTSLILYTHWTQSSDMQLFTDIPGIEEWGAFWQGHWLQARWSHQQSAMVIVWKELYAVV